MTEMPRGDRAFWETSRTISHAEAMEVAAKFIAKFFGNDNCEYPKVSIPANPDRDDDLVLISYILQQERDAIAAEAATKERDELRTEIERLSMNLETTQAALEYMASERDAAEAARTTATEKRDELRAEVERLREVLGWRPIAEAPQDGTEVLLFVPGHDGGVYQAHFDTEWPDDGVWVDLRGMHVHSATHYLRIGSLPEVES